MIYRPSGRCDGVTLPAAVLRAGGSSPGHRYASCSPLPVAPAVEASAADFGFSEEKGFFSGQNGQE